MAKNCIPTAVATCCTRLRSAGFAAHPVGGCVRDLLLGRTPSDWDIATAARPEEVAALFPTTIPTGVLHGTVTVLVAGVAMEVTAFRRETTYADGRHPDRVQFGADLTEDLARRDFTINAMALSPEGAVIDPFGGQADLKNRCIRCVGDPERRFAEDALRLLRAVRFGAQLGFTIEGRTLAAIVSNAGRVTCLSAERVTAELGKALCSPRPEGALQMATLGLLAPFLPAGDYEADFGPQPDEGARWRAFCHGTGLSLAALPVSRALRRAVSPPTRDLVGQLALTGGDLHRLGLRGTEIAAAQKNLLAHIQQHPADNNAATLTALLNYLTP